ncbi:hypothetical protein Hanom_Chr02g00174621 [Helianthus anomalus]
MTGGGGVENVYIQKFIYENYINNTTERKVRGVGRPHPRPLLYFSPGLLLADCRGLGLLFCYKCLQMWFADCRRFTSEKQTTPK